MNYYFWGSVIVFVSIYSSYKGYFYIKEKLYNHIIEKVNEKLKNDIEDYYINLFNGKFEDNINLDQKYYYSFLQWKSENRSDIVKTKQNI
ncbi:unnamed protein product, partial [marine sediment metagenome]